MYNINLHIKFILFRKLKYQEGISLAMNLLLYQESVGLPGVSLKTQFGKKTARVAWQSQLI